MATYDFGNVFIQSLMAGREMHQRDQAQRQVMDLRRQQLAEQVAARQNAEEMSRMAHQLREEALGLQREELDLNRDWRDFQMTQADQPDVIPGQFLETIGYDGQDIEVPRGSSGAAISAMGNYRLAQMPGRGGSSTQQPQIGGAFLALQQVETDIAEAEERLRQAASEGRRDMDLEDRLASLRDTRTKVMQGLNPAETEAWSQMILAQINAAREQAEPQQEPSPFDEHDLSVRDVLLNRNAPQEQDRVDVERGGIDVMRMLRELQQGGMSVPAATTRGF